eukprot:TRINITY_DN5461_c0_g1_i1.p1 TRINITY_DN5461_c0_g1~~TRINITY_DN5461_c0_g1_i1.p1  ORF type:complete len:201 (+),score=15.66 TRINITY_DN5461_c0_g1_i1:163-765(+)
MESSLQQLLVHTPSSSHPLRAPAKPESRTVSQRTVLSAWTLNAIAQKSPKRNTLHSSKFSFARTPSYVRINDKSVLPLTEVRSAERASPVVRMMADPAQAVSGDVDTVLGIRVERQPSEERLKALGVRKWPKWGCGVSEFPWTYSEREQCYLLEGKVKVTPAGQTDKFVEFGAGDFVEFPAGLSCTWSVSEAVDKHYQFG